MIDLDPFRKVQNLLSKQLEIKISSSREALLILSFLILFLLNFAILMKIGPVPIIILMPIFQLALPSCLVSRLLLK